MNRGQWLAFDATLALCAALVLSVVLMHNTASHPSTGGDLALERAGYDMVNAFYMDPALGPRVAAALEKRGYMNETEMGEVNATLGRYAQQLGIKRAEMQVDGGQAVVAGASTLPATEKATFYATITLNGGAGNRLVRLALWK